MRDGRRRVREAQSVSLSRGPGWGRSERKSVWIVSRSKAAFDMIARTRVAVMHDWQLTRGWHCR
eukprot:400970-Rhodomonas_salina.1